MIILKVFSLDYLNIILVFNKCVKFFFTKTSANASIKIIEGTQGC